MYSGENIISPLINNTRHVVYSFEHFSHCCLSMIFRISLKFGWKKKLAKKSKGPIRIRTGVTRRFLIKSKPWVITNYTIGPVCWKVMFWHLYTSIIWADLNNFQLLELLIILIKTSLLLTINVIHELNFLVIEHKSVY